MAIVSPDDKELLHVKPELQLYSTHTHTHTLCVLFIEPGVVIS